MRTLLTPIVLALLTGGIALAQGSEPSDWNVVVRRAIERRASTREAVRSLTAALHTTSVITVRNDSSRVALVPNQTFVQEAAGTLYRDRTIGTRIRIQARRGTVSAPGIARSLVENFASLGDYFSIDDDRIVLLNTAIASPLADDAFRYYSFERGKRVERNGVPSYAIEVVPRTSLYPVFTGTLYVAREGYDPVAMELSPAEETAIPFVRDLHLTQTFSPVGGTYQIESFELRGSGAVRAVAFGLVEPAMDFMITTRLTDRQRDLPIPDSIVAQPERLVVAEGADAAPASFWSGRSSLTREQVAAIEGSARGGPERTFSFSAAPYIDYNRVGSASLGGTVGVSLGPAAIGGTAGYSFGLERPIGEGTVAVSFGDAASLQTTLRGSAFSQLATTSTGDKSYPRIMNTLVAASLHQDYYDFFRKDGWNAGADLQYGAARLGVTYERSQQFSTDVNARWSLLTWTGKEFQDNPPITEGSYQTMQAELSWGRVVPFLKITPVDAPELRWSLTGMTGANRVTDTSFRLVEALVSLSLPLIPTGYNPMTLTLLGAGGTASATLPPQYQFRLRTSAASFGKPGGMVSPPKGLYGGTEYLALGAEFNLTDLVWRAAGLPTYNGRGVELILAGAAARYRQSHHTGFTGTGDQWYPEAGVALSRIPLFLTDIVAGRVDLRWGLGPLGQFGGNFTFVVPL